MKILFWGGINSNNGPCNINKGIVKNFTDNFRYVTTPGKYRELADALWKLCRSDVLLVSGVSRKSAILVAAAKLLRKPSAYLMHGCAEHENKLNEQKPNKKGLAQEAYLLKNADLILAVSRRYMSWVQLQYPQYAEKIDFVYNGVNKEMFEKKTEFRKKSVDVSAYGGLLPSKNLMPVILAMELIEGKSELYIYGGKEESSAVQYHHTKFMGRVPHKEFLEGIGQSRIFVMNSVFEPFSITVMEALACGCSLLVSERAGVSDLLALEETDIIHDPMDVEEICQKIEYLLEHPNNQRLYDAFDPEEWSFEKMVLRLEEKCRELMRKNKSGRE